MSLPSVNFQPSQPVFNIFTTSYQFNPGLPARPEILGSVSFDAPGWSCGLNLVVHEGCIPDVNGTSDGCYQTETGIVMEAEPAYDLPKNCHTHSCKAYTFMPLNQSLGAKGKLPCSSREMLLSNSLAALNAYSHYNPALHLMLGHNSNPAAPDNPGVAYYGQDIGGGVKHDICEALGWLHQAKDGRSLGRGTLIAPINVYLLMVKQGLAFVGPDNKPYTAMGTPILIDPALDGSIGPPATPWDGTAPIGLPDLQPAPDGCAWVYMTSGVETARTTAGEIPTDEADENNIQRNTITALPEMKSIAVFNPCQVYAVLINTKVKVGC